MSRLTREGTAKHVLRDQFFKRDRGQRKFIFPVQLAIRRIGNLIRLLLKLLKAIPHTQHADKLLEITTAVPQYAYCTYILFVAMTRILSFCPYSHCSHLNKPFDNFPPDWVDAQNN